MSALLAEEAWVPALPPTTDDPDAGGRKRPEFQALSTQIDVPDNRWVEIATRGVASGGSSTKSVTYEATGSSKPTSPRATCWRTRMAVITLVTGPPSHACSGPFPAPTPHASAIPRSARPPRFAPEPSCSLGHNPLELVHAVHPARNIPKAANRAKSRRGSQPASKISHGTRAIRPPHSAWL
jgi:hypothetical protein